MHARLIVLSRGRHRHIAVQGHPASAPRGLEFTALSFTQDTLIFKAWWPASKLYGCLQQAGRVIECLITTDIPNAMSLYMEGRGDGMSFIPYSNSCDILQAIEAGGRSNEGQRFVPPMQMPVPSVRSKLSGLLSRGPELRNDRTSFDDLQGTAVTLPSVMMPQSADVVAGSVQSPDDGLQVRTPCVIDWCTSSCYRAVPQSSKSDFQSTSIHRTVVFRRNCRRLLQACLHPSRHLRGSSKRHLLKQVPECHRKCVSGKSRPVTTATVR